MVNINRKETSDTPKIFFDEDKKILSITGNSYPENCELVYNPIKDFLDNYSFEKHSSLNFHFHFNLISSTSTVYVAQIIMKVADLAQKGLSVFINWKYDEFDDEMLDLGKKFSTISKLPIDFVSVKEED